MARKLDRRKISEMAHAAAEREKDKAQMWQGDSNPQVIEMKIRAEARAEAFEAVANAIDGTSISELKIFSEM